MTLLLEDFQRTIGDGTETRTGFTLLPYLSLHTGATPMIENEVSGGGYARITDATLGRHFVWHLRTLADGSAVRLSWPRRALQFGPATGGWGQVRSFGLSVSPRAGRLFAGGRIGVDGLALTRGATLPIPAGIAAIDFRIGQAVPGGAHITEAGIRRMMNRTGVGAIEVRGGALLNGSRVWVHRLTETDRVPTFANRIPRTAQNTSRWDLVTAHGPAGPYTVIPPAGDLTEGTFLNASIIYMTYLLVFRDTPVAADQVPTHWGLWDSSRSTATLLAWGPVATPDPLIQRTRESLGIRSRSFRLRLVDAAPAPAA